MPNDAAQPSPDVAAPTIAGQDAVTAELARADAARRDGRLNEADGIAQDLLARTPGLAPALALRAYVAVAQDDTDRAVGLLAQAVASRQDPSWLLLLCALYRRRFRLDEALAAATAAVARTAGAARLDPLMELARVQVDRGETDGAAESFLAALAVDPDHPGAHLGLGQVLLASGQYEPGWIEYEWRNKLPEAIGRIPAIKAATWNGMNLPRGRLLVVCDQGFGDAIQFSRYLPFAAARVRELVLAVGPELSPLFARIEGVSQCWHQWRDIPAFTAHTLISSLPFTLCTRADNIPAAKPYLTSDPDRVAAWAARLETLSGGRRRIGLFWSGRPTHPNNARRSLTLAALSPIVEAAAGAFLVSLQKDLTPNDAAVLRTLGVYDPSAELETFDDTAAMLAALDLLITVDSAVAHLAGALGRPVWILVPTPSDWRWLRDRDDSPWYPSLRLFRQPKPGDWQTPIAQAAAMLEKPA